MRSLFFKIFFWFWVSNSLIALVVLASVVLSEFEPLTVRWRESTEAALAFYAQGAIEELERHGQAGVSVYLDRLESASARGSQGIRAMLLDDAGREVSGRPLSNGAAALAERATRSRRAELNFSSISSLAAWSASDSRGKRFVLVLQIPGGPFRPFRQPPRMFLLRALLVLLTATIVCYWFSRYLASPVVRLRAATQQLAAGDLSARVGPDLGTRRDEVADLGHDFDRMADRIQALVAAQQRLIGDISHELRSPLARLGVALELARQKAGEAALPALERIERESARLNELIGQLLTLAKLETGAGPAPADPIDLALLVRGVTDDADYEARGRNRAVRVLQCDTCRIHGSESLLRSAIENVIRNAVRYTPETTNVEVSLQRVGDLQALLSVRDHGPGVPESALGDLLRPFYRVADARDRQTGGIGLGLAIADRAVRLHGGAIDIQNHPDGGLLVKITLPLK